MYKYIENYINYIINNRNKSLNTAKAYKRDLTDLHDFLKNKYNNIKKFDKFDKYVYENISLVDLDEFMIYLKKEKKNSNATRNRKGIAVREFFKYLKRIKIIKNNIAEELELPKIPQTVHNWLTEEEAVKIINATKTYGGAFKIRDTCILIIFLTTGIRLNELLNICYKDIQDNTLIITTGKGNKQRRIPLSNIALKAIKAYTEYRKGLVNKDDYLFVSKSGNKLYPSNIDRIVKKYAKYAGINKTISAHKLRHTYASVSYNDGRVDIRSLQEILGHSNISTTQIYTHVNDEKLKDSINRNPITKDVIL